MPQRIAKVAQEYAARQLTVGEAFEVEQGHIEVLLLLGRIEPIEGEAGYVAREIVADTPAVYVTRDLQAERRHSRPRKAQ